MKMDRYPCDSENSSAQRSRRAGFTLVELLVVIAIIGVLVALLLPAVQAARESARRTSCLNQLKQLALGFHQHHDVQGHFPSSGWGWTWIGDPDRGFGRGQPGGWTYNVLPFIEQAAVHDFAKGSTYSQGNPSKQELLSQMMQMVQPIFHCPSRRTAILRKTGPDLLINTKNPGTNAKTDYGINSGSVVFYMQEGPKNFRFSKNFEWESGEFQVKDVATGIAAYDLMLSMSKITDGTSNTLLIGEKYMDPLQYESGAWCVDDQGLYYGLNCDDAMFSNRGRIPQPDTPNLTLWYNWGSAHPGTWQVAFCDGSVRGLNYDIDEIVFTNLGARNDGQTIGDDF